MVARPRLDDLLHREIERHPLLFVCATPGAGKTTAVAEVTAGFGRPVAWLSLDESDAAPGRLLTYLEAALGVSLPDLGRVASDALGTGLSHPEAAGLLAEAIGDEEPVVVLDDLQRLGDRREAWAVIEAFVRYAPQGVRIVLLSRRDLPPDACDLLTSLTLPTIGEQDLAFTREEAAEALERVGRPDADADVAVRATGGWVTGVLFEAWRSTDHVAGIGGEADPLNGYLASHILGQLQPEERDFLVETSLLDYVTAERAEALGHQEPGRTLLALKAAHLPVTWDDGARMMTCHQRFREYLLARLERRGREEVLPLRRLHAELLASEGQDEEATEAFLLADAPERAAECAGRAIGPVIDRLDLGVAQRWLATLGLESPTGSTQLATAELMVAITRDDYRRGVRIADHLAALGEREQLAAASPRAAALMSWCYLHAARLDDIEAILEATDAGPDLDAIRYALWLLGDRPDEEAPRLPLSGGGPLDLLSLQSSYYLGRLGELAHLPDTRWATEVSKPYRIAALRAIGRTQEALELYEEVMAAGAPGRVLEISLGPEVLIDAGRLEEARDALEAGLERARECGSIGFEATNRVAAAKLALRLERDPDTAREILDELERNPAIQRFRLTAEHLDVWYGLALLQQGADSEALERLQRAVDGMTAGGRNLELPTAAVYLAEACWRAEDEDGADAAADLALETAGLQGSNHLLLQALSDFPAVASRRIDAEADADSRWHEIGRALAVQVGPDAKALGGTVVRLCDFGAPRILSDEDEVRPRLRKSYELFALLCARRGTETTRDALLDALFEGRRDRSARAYLRQVVHQLRAILPDPDVLEVSEGSLRLPDSAPVTSDSVLFEQRLREAARFQGRARLRATAAALELADAGEYMEGIYSEWIEERRRKLADMAGDARYEAAETALSAGSLDRARRLVEESLAANPYREGAWRLLMRVGSALGDEAAVLAAFGRCEAALAELGATPSAATRQLLDRLRR